LVEMRPPDKALRERLFARFLRENGWEDADLVKELAIEPTANVREIIGTVNRIVAAAELSGRGHTKSVAMQAVRPAAPRRPTQSVPVQPADVLPLDAEKLIVEWPDAVARLIEELQ
jgi:chromosomal replication initiation ATPase DnaA